VITRGSVLKRERPAQRCWACRQSELPAAARVGRLAPRSGKTPVTLQLSFLEKVQFGGSFMADARDYFAGQGLAVSFLPGGRNIAAEPVALAEKALVGISHTSECAQAIGNGAPLTIIGAGYQKNPFRIIFQEERADRDTRCDARQEARRRDCEPAGVQRLPEGQGHSSIRGECGDDPTMLAAGKDGRPHRRRVTCVQRLIPWPCTPEGRARGGEPCARLHRPAGVDGRRWAPRQLATGFAKQ
jgi:hypothetical protein